MDYKSFFNRDYNSRPTTLRHRGAQRHWRMRAALLATGLAVLGVVLAKSHDPAEKTTTSSAIEAHDTQNVLSAARITLPLTLPLSPATPNSSQPVSTTQATDSLPWQAIKVRPGDSLSSIFSRLEIHSQMAKVLALGEPVKPLTRLRAGESLRIQIDDDGVRGLVYEPDETRFLNVWRDTTGLHAEWVKPEIETRIGRAAGTIQASLFESGLKSGLSENLIMELAGIFGWDVDFALDIRQGDQFTLVYEELYRDGEKVRDGRILAAEFVNQGKAFQAVLYTDPSGKTDYYSPNGRSMRKTFLRAPVDFRRISSRFSGERYHPILGKKRPHRGVDYAAATGTPIKAAGDGKVIFRGTKGGYGRTVIIQHGATYSTLYGHMSNFTRGVGVGTRVRQGQTIGYVGQSGLATGPHLHYEFRVNGVHRNPLTVKLPSAKPLNPEYMADFQATATPLLAQLDVYKRTVLALQ